MRIARIDSCEIVNGNNVGVSLYIQGCPIHCKGCFNPETWDFDGGELWTTGKELDLYKILKPSEIHRLSILGGEPLYEENIMELYCLLVSITTFFFDKEIWLWTGYTWEELQIRINRVNSEWPNIVKDSYLYPLLKQIDYIITGPFIEEQKDLTLQWKGSKNQEFLCCSDSIAAKKKIFAK